MATNLKFQGKDPIDHHHLKETNQNNLSSNRYLKSIPLGLRRSVSHEDISIDLNLQKSLKESCSNVSFQDPSLSSSLNCLCFRLRPHQLLPEFNENIARSDREHQFDWWNTINHLRPLIENIILYEQLNNYFEDDQDKQDKYFIQFIKSKRNGRRNGVCLTIDKLYFNQQMILFVAITNEIQVQYNLMSSGFKI